MCIRDRAQPAERLGCDDDVGFDAVLLEGEPRPGAPAAGLDLVHDQRDVQRPGQLAQAADELGVGRYHPALALDQFEQDGGRERDAAVRVGERMLQVARAVDGAGRPLQPERAAVAVGVREEVHSGHPAPDGGLLFDQSGHGEGGERAAVEAALEADHLLAAGGRLAQLQGRLDGVRSGRAAEVDLRAVAHRLGEHPERQLGELVLDRGGEVQAVDQLVELAVRGGERLGRVVAEREHPGPGEEVEEDVAVEVLDITARRPADRDRQPPGIRTGVGLAPVLPVQQLRAARAGEAAPHGGTGRGEVGELGHDPLQEDGGTGSGRAAARRWAGRARATRATRAVAARPCTAA